ncbi:MAG: hypothetical protein R3F51_00955 [Cyanobacteriota/Melainabacteria group bacterium]
MAQSPEKSMIKVHEARREIPKAKNNESLSIFVPSEENYSK